MIPVHKIESFEDLQKAMHDFTTNAHVIAKAYQHAREEYPRQSVGYVRQVDDPFASQPYEYVSLVNDSATPEVNFHVTGYLAPQEIAMIHSRTCPDNTSTAPGRQDMQMQQGSRTPWAVFHCNGTQCSNLQWFGDQLPIPPLLGRKFVSGYADCWCLVRDVYRAQFGIVLENVPRDEDWCLGDHPNDFFSPENIERTGFKIISKEEARAGDVLLGRIKSKVNNHCALLLEDGYVLQQFSGSGYRSRRESIAQWAKLVTHVGRHKSFVDDPDSIPKIVVD